MVKPMKSHLVTLSFDDGFADSFARTAAIYEEFGMKASLNVMAGFSDPGATGVAQAETSFPQGATGVAQAETSFPQGAGLPNMWHNAPVGDWDLWNGLAARGHEIMPHGWDHANLAQVPFAEGCLNIDRCLAAFEKNLKGFRTGEAIFNFPYNASTPSLETYLMVKARVRAYRATGGGKTGPPREGSAAGHKSMAYNRWPSTRTARVTNSAFGPGNCEENLDRELDGFLTGTPGWFVYNLHGLDNEGWGPVTADYLRRLLERLSRMDDVEVIPAATALKKYGSKEARSLS
jgi:peptidoglycan/xylan/chitin deacetylase (PgdA/CDA1 family)